MNPRTRIPVALAAGLLGSLMLAVPMPAGALPDPTPTPAPTAAPPEFSLAISPTRLVVSQDDLATTQEIKVINGGTSSMRVTVDLQNFTGAHDGTLLFQETAAYSASEWVTVSPMTFDLPAGETEVVSVAIEVPPDPEPGDHHLALIFLVPAGESAANVKINRGIGMPVFITVPGPIDDSVEVTDLDAGGFSMGGPIDLTATLKDTGSVHRDFRGETPLLVDTSGDADPFPDFTVMRGGTRDVTTSWDPPFMCLCHPSVSVTNADGSISSQSDWVFVFPLKLAAMILVGLLIALGVYRLALRRYRASVLEAAAALRPVVDHGGG
jgi:hypothetical protein